MKTKTKKYKVSNEHAIALLGCESMINTQGEKVFDIAHVEGQNYVIIYPGKLELFFRNVHNLRRLFGGIASKFQWDKVLPACSEVTGDEFIF